jgi:signal transduction histidine kinase
MSFAYLAPKMHKHRQMDKNFTQPTSDYDVFVKYLNKTGGNGRGRDQTRSRPGQDNTFLSSFLEDLVHCIKSSLFSINNSSHLALEKFDDLGFRVSFRNRIAEDIKKVDSVLNTLVNYIHISTPLRKTNTMEIIVEEIIEASEKQLAEKQIRIYKECEKDLPETYMHHEQVRFVLSSLLQYAILSTPPNGSIGLSIKYFPAPSPTAERAVPDESNGGYIGVTFRSSGDTKVKKSSESGKGYTNGQEDEALSLILKLVKEIMEKNYEEINVRMDDGKGDQLISLRFHIERRKKVHYEPIKI